MKIKKKKKRHKKDEKNTKEIQCYKEWKTNHLTKYICIFIYTQNWNIGYTKYTSVAFNSVYEKMFGKKCLLKAGIFIKHL